MSSAVVVGCPVRERAWILPDYLARLDALLPPALRHLRFEFVVQPGADRTEEIIAAWCAVRPHASWGRVTGAPAGHSREAGPGHYDYRWLAAVRNVLAHRALAVGADLFSVDSDVLISPETLIRLDRHNLPVVAALISNTPGLSPDHPAAQLNARALPGAPPATAQLMRAGLCEVAMTGACCLYRREVFASGVRWGAHRSGEDFALCEQARAAGFRLYLDGGVRAEHRMVPPAHASAHLAPVR